MGITGSSKVSDKNRSVKKGEVATKATDDDAPQNPFRDDTNDDGKAASQVMSGDTVDVKEISSVVQAKTDGADVQFV
jgi:hypothetical protein